MYRLMFVALIGLGSALEECRLPDGSMDITRCCRSRNGIFLPETQFKYHTCALCYRYMMKDAFLPNRKWNQTKDNLPMMLIFGNETVLANSSDEQSPLMASFRGEDTRSKWRQCCDDAMKCCAKMRDDKPNRTQAGWCPRTWDGWQCWDDAPPNTTQSTYCPTYNTFGTSTPSCHRAATKECLEGRWFVLSFRDEEWTNYTACSSVDLMKQRVYVSVAAYSVTLASLVPALIIFYSYRSLQVHRIILHKNLFVSLLINAIFVILFKTVVILGEFEDDSITKENGIGCKLLLISTKYFRLSNYMWMFCEGFYLHRLIASAFAEQKSLALFYAIGWGLPVIPTVIYAVLRATIADEQCWAVPAGAVEWTLYTPCLCSLVINTVFLINIIRILVTKLRAAHSNEPDQYRKAVRATLVLVPLFGLHSMVTIYRPESGACEWKEAYLYVDYFLDGLQGFLVSLIFCYLNGEVHYHLKRSYRRFVESRNPDFRARSSRGSILTRSCNSTHFSVMDSVARRPSNARPSVPLNKFSNGNGVDADHRIASTSFLSSTTNDQNEL